MCIDSLYSSQFSLFVTYMMSEQFASTWRASVAQTSSGAPVSAEKELRHVRTQLLAKVTARAGFQVQKSKPGKIFRGLYLQLFELFVSFPCIDVQHHGVQLLDTESFKIVLTLKVIEVLMSAVKTLPSYKNNYDNKFCDCLKFSLRPPHPWQTLPLLCFVP